MHDEAYLKWFDKHSKKRPDHFPHGLHDTPENPISEQLKNNYQLKPTNWRMEGVGTLVADTPMGKLVQRIGTDVLLVGTDKQGMPIFRKISL
jgi:hypothetical protein